MITLATPMITRAASGSCAAYAPDGIRRQHKRVLKLMQGAGKPGSTRTCSFFQDKRKMKVGRPMPILPPRVCDAIPDALIAVFVL